MSCLCSGHSCGANTSGGHLLEKLNTFLLPHIYAGSQCASNLLTLQKSSDCKNLANPFIRPILASSPHTKGSSCVPQLYATGCSSFHTASCPIKLVTLSDPWKLRSSAPNQGAGRRLQAKPGFSTQLGAACIQVDGSKAFLLDDLLQLEIKCAAQPCFGVACRSLGKAVLNKLSLTLLGFDPLLLWPT